MCKFLLVAFWIFNAQGYALNKDDFIYLGEFTPTLSKGRVSTQTSVYYVSTTQANWGDAYLSCSFAMGGGQVATSLLTIETAEENTAIRNLMIGRGLGSAWVNGAYDPASDAFRWVSTGEFVQYGVWATGHPIRSPDSRLIVENSLFGGTTWSSGAASLSKVYICEELSTVTPVTSPTKTPTPTIAPTTPSPSTAPAGPDPEFVISAKCGEVLNGVNGRIFYNTYSTTEKQECTWTIISKTSSGVRFNLREIAKDHTGLIQSFTHSEPYRSERFSIYWPAGPHNATMYGNIFVLTYYTWSTTRTDGRLVVDFEGLNDKVGDTFFPKVAGFITNGPSDPSVPSRIIYPSNGNEISSFVFAPTDFLLYTGKVLQFSLQIALPDTTCDSNVRIYSYIYTGYVLEEILCYINNATYTRSFSGSSTILLIFDTAAGASRSSFQMDYAWT